MIRKMYKKTKKHGILAIAFIILLLVIILLDVDRDKYLISCDKKWIEFNNLCYFISKDKLNWNDSMAVCNNLGSNGNYINLNMTSGILNTSNNYWIKTVDEVDCTNTATCNFLYSNVIGCDICNIEKFYVCVKPIGKINLFNFFVEYGR
ncbi:C-type lectin-like protein [Penguinpox virus]|uniref:C-type lectin-like protein n=1 Tax=Penguinpox virus TaxID=648998 RepID=A0A068EHX7_9POXV|nr:C-type lectin-like protein [Penguinpox virus]AID46968.1 C-type lectin-like protein [Penguinpox virus]